MTIAYTHDELSDLAGQFGVNVEQITAREFRLIGPSICIRLDLGDHADAESPEYRKVHRYWPRRVDPFRHPITGIKLDPSLKTPTRNVVDAIQAALYVPPHLHKNGQSITDLQYLKLQLFSKQSGLCSYCNKLLRLCESTLDHIVPLSRGGLEIADNICIACEQCNADKRDMTASEFYSKRALLIGA